MYIPWLYPCHSSFSKPFFRLFYVTSSSLNSPGELCTFSNLSVTSPTSQLILQPFRRFTYVTAHSPTLPLLHLLHSSFSKHFFRFSYVTSSSLNSPGELCSFSNLSVSSPTSQLILQPFRRLTYVTAHSPTLPLLHLRHSSFSNPSFASPASQALHSIHLVSRPWLWDCLGSGFPLPVCFQT